MLVNPDGPGGSGLIFAALGGLVPDGADDAYLAVVCTDAPWTTNYDHYRFDNWMTHLRAHSRPGATHRSTARA